MPSPLPAAMLVAAFAFPALAQHSIPWSTLDTGATTSVAGPYSLRGTIGQPDVSPPSHAGNLSLAGGFWPAFADSIRCPADLSGSSDPNDPAYGQPDGLVDSSDFFFYLDQFTSGNLALADLSGSADPNDPSYGVPDGAIDSSDFFYYLDLFVAGCP